MVKKFPYRYLAIDGPIAAGKTTLAKITATSFNILSMLEDLRNPLLPLFYQAPQSYRLSVQLYFLVSRHISHIELKSHLKGGKSVVSDFTFWKDSIFAKVNLTKPEMKIYRRMWEALSKDAVVPDIVVWLDAPEEFLFDRIWKRGRKYEESLSLEYLEKLRRGYKEFFESWQNCKVIKIRADKYDFEHNRGHERAVLNAIVEQSDLT